MEPQTQKTGPTTDLWAQRLLRAVADEVCRRQGENRLSSELAAEIYTRLRDVLACSELPSQGIVVPGLIDELALAIFLAVVSSGYDQRDPSLLPAVKRLLQGVLVDSKPVRSLSSPVG